MARVTVSLPDSLLARIDDAAGEAGLSRSEVIREASASYLTERERDAERHALREAIEEGIVWMRAVGRQPGLDGRPSLEILRDVRRLHDSAPLPHMPEGTE